MFGLVRALGLSLGKECFSVDDVSLTLALGARVHYCQKPQNSGAEKKRFAVGILGMGGAF